MPMLKKLKLFFSLFCICCLFLASGCGSKQATAIPKDALSYVLDSEPSTLDPVMTFSLTESTLELALYDGLTRIDAHNRPQPALAQSWTLSPDGLTYIFKLRPQIQWSDGTPITAEDFVFSWLRALAPTTASSNAYMLYNIKNAEAYNSGKAKATDVGVQALDKQTLKVTLAAPAPYFLELTSFHCFYPVPKHKLAQSTQAWGSNEQDLVSSGPFKLVHWNHGNEITLVKNEKYWNAAAVKPNYLRLPISSSNSTRLNLVESKMADMMLTPPTADEERLAKSGLLHIFPQLGTSYYVFNVQKPPFNNKEVRKAFALALQRQDLLKYVVRGGSTPAFAFVPPTIQANNVDFRQEGGNLITEDIPAAQATLQQAYKGEPITLLFDNSDRSRMIAEAVQALWKKNLGVQVALTNQESKVFFDSREHGNYQVACANWIADFADPINFLQVFSGSTNDAQYHNPAYEKIIKNILAETDVTKRTQLLHQAEKILFDDYVLIPIYYTAQTAVMNPALQGVTVLPMGPIDFINAYRK